MASDLGFCPLRGSLPREHTAITLPNSVGFLKANHAQTGGHERQRKRHQALQRDFERSQRAARRSPRTIGTYREAIDQLAAFLERSGMPTSVPAIRREHVEAFMDELNGRTKPATASNRFRALQQFFKFAVEEDEIERSPMERMHRPTVPVEPVPVLSTDELRALLAACAGKEFEDKRDTAVVRLFVDTGGSASSRGRLPERSWLVRMRRDDRSVIVAIGLPRTGADRLAEQITDLLA